MERFAKLVNGLFLKSFLYASARPKTLILKTKKKIRGSKGIQEVIIK